MNIMSIFHGIVCRTAMHGAAQWQWMARWLLDGKGRCDGSSAAMDGDGRRESDGDGPQAQR